MMDATTSSNHDNIASSRKESFAGNAADESHRTKEHLLRVPAPYETVALNSSQEPTPGPKSILNSGRKKLGRDVSPRKTRKTVAFGSPEAAEYNKHSPSVSMTPLPPDKVKTMFLIPRSTSDSDRSMDSSTNRSVSMSHDAAYACEDDGAEHTAQLEGDINTLLINAQSSDFGVTTKGAGDIRNAMEPLNLDMLSEKHDSNVLALSISSPQQNINDPVNSFGSANFSSISSVRQNVRLGCHNSNDGYFETESPSDKCLHSDAVTSKHHRGTLEVRSEVEQKLDIQEDLTVQLEGDVYSLLATAQMINGDQDEVCPTTVDDSFLSDTGMDISREETTLEFNEETVALESNVNALLGTVQVNKEIGQDTELDASFEFTDSTLELETNVDSLLKSARQGIVLDADKCQCAEVCSDTAHLGATAESIEDTLELEKH